MSASLRLLTYASVFALNKIFLCRGLGGLNGGGVMAKISCCLVEPQVVPQPLWLLAPPPPHRADGPVYEAVTCCRPTRERRCQRRLVQVRTPVQSRVLAAAPAAAATLIECSLFTLRTPLNGPFQVTVIYMQVITAGDDG